MKKVILWTLVVLVAAAGVFLVPVLWLKPWTPDLFYGRIFFSFALRHPLLLTQMGMFENTPFRWYADDLDDMSPRQALEALYRLKAAADAETSAAAAQTRGARAPRISTRP